MGYSKSELLLLDKTVLADIILEQERRLTSSRRGQPKRDNLVGETFAALTVVGDAGNQQAHSIWYCRCSGDIYNPGQQGVCDNQAVFWGSNLKADRHQHCGRNSCPAVRQVLASKRQKELPSIIVKDPSEFVKFLQTQLLQKFALMGKEAAQLISTEEKALVTLLHSYYGFNEARAAYKLDEIGQMLKRKDVSELKRQLEWYVRLYYSSTREPITLPDSDEIL